jgi:rSAM/selenodomain-associated transferase 1
MAYQFPDSLLLIFCKAPIAGQVKTRLQPELSAEQAAAAHRRLSRFTLDRAFQHALCPVRLYCAPDSLHPFFSECAAEYPLTLANQGSGHLGEKMHQAFVEALADYPNAVLIGCDCPSLTLADLRLAFSYLQAGKPAVIAPAEDGGYVLIGLNAPQPALFENIVWGGEQVLQDTLQRAAEAGIEVEQLDRQWDVDTAADWQRFLACQPVQEYRK